MQHTGGRQQLLADQVLKNGKTIGISSGRTYSYHYRQMISLCSLDSAHCALGSEVSILWGSPGTRQKQIRATVSRFPYLNENRNEKVDVGTIQCVVRKIRRAIIWRGFLPPLHPGMLDDRHKAALE